jgi:hypothetical protein
MFREAPLIQKYKNKNKNKRKVTYDLTEVRKRIEEVIYADLMQRRKGYSVQRKDKE